MCYDQHRAQLGDISLESARQYAKRHDYELTVYRQVLVPSLPASFSVLEAVRLEMERDPQTALFLRLDADAIIVNQSICLEDLAHPDKALVLSQDWHGLCAGVCLVHNCSWARELLRALIFLGEMRAEQWRNYDGRNTWEQSVLKCLAGHFSSVSDQIALLPESVVQNPRAAYSPDAFVMHYWSNSGLEAIKSRMLEVQKNGWSPAAFLSWAQISSVRASPPGSEALAPPPLPPSP